MAPVIFISAGEASGEHYGALLASALRHKLAPKGERAELLVGMGGPRMAAAGVECIVRAEKMAVMGFTEIVTHLPRIWREFQKLKQAIRARRPSIAVLIDFPEIHFRLAKLFHELGVPVIWFVSPQLWAWKQHRIELVRRYVKRMLVIFPFEEPFYRERGVAAEFVGHPLAELPPPVVSREEFAAQSGLDAARTWIGLLPGSRMKEIEANLPEMLKAAQGLKPITQGLKPQAKGAASGTADVTPATKTRRRGPRSAVPFRDQGIEADLQKNEKAESQTRAFEFIIPLAPTLDPRQQARVARLAKANASGLSVQLVHDARATLLHARASVVASGTATVEAALIGNPFVVVYRVSSVTYAIAKRVVKVPHVAMANLIARKRVVPELIQHDFTAANIVQQLARLLPDGPDRESMKMELGAIQTVLRAPAAAYGAGSGAIARVADVVIEELRAGSPAAAAARQQ
jgi:lipid-A-disaccharide synthase